LRALIVAALAIALGAPALAQAPAPETFTFENVPGLTPIPYAIEVKVPKTARIKSFPLADGGTLAFRTKGGANYAALVTHFGTTAIVGVSASGKIQPFRDLEIRIRKSDACFASFVAIQAGARLDNNGTPNDATDDTTVYDGPGRGDMLLYDSDKDIYPQSGVRLGVVRFGGDPLDLVKDSYDLTTTSLDFTRIIILGEVVYDDVVVKYGRCGVIPLP
jgi:hypothetical protein